MKHSIPAPFFASKTYCVSLLAGLALLLLIPGLLLAAPFGTDGPVHIRWQIAFAHEIMDGHLFPRWLPGMNDGFGSPAFFFYPPLLQWVGALFTPLLPRDDQAIRRLALALWLLSWMGALGCQAWLRILGATPRAALLGAMLWLAAPYRAFVDTYQRSALAECASLCLLPWLGYCAVRVSRRVPGSWALHGLSIGALAYAHMPGMVIGYLFVTGHALALIMAENGLRARFEVAAALSSSALLGLALAAPMLLPALGLLDHIVDATAISGERNQPHNWLLFSSIPWIDHVAWIMTLGLVVVTVLIAVLMAPAAVLVHSARSRAVAWAMLATVGVVAVLNTSISMPFWELQTPVSRIQFPFRLLGASSLAVSILAALAYDHFRAAGETRRASLLCWLLAAMILGDLTAFAYQRLRPRVIFPLTIHQVMASNHDTSEYILGDLNEVVQRFSTQRALVVDGGGIAGITLGRMEGAGRRLSVSYHASRGAALALRQFGFTGWQCRIDRGEWTDARLYRFGSSPRSGTVPVCAIPGGTHRLEARLTMTMPERLGLWLGFASSVVLFIMLCQNIILHIMRHRQESEGGII
ncbi:hypothetical protein [Novosphingobium sediminicola]|uniref:Membrane protein 6-pyruvoyl-tetrahydropterin synthase-related domain-containing protein n=1 Tax=Novosphingobium sediminicola TaxID=563162 RepID=A0A7W6CMB8_9SPHN|nr:hypothetical protein [Novosphingobium sediminicola]MBB3957053.1 hypothetical protein [Novosphingobium sediminicola]